MFESSLGVLFLGLIGFCSVLITIASLITTRALWQASYQLNTLFSHGKKTLHETHQMVGTARQLLARTDKAAARVEGMIDKTCGVAESVLEQIDFVKEKTQTFWTRQFGNGTKPRSRNGQRK